MGIVNDYINKIVSKINDIKDIKYDKDKPWLKYYDRMPEHLEYYNGSMYDILEDTKDKYPDYIALEYFDTKYTYRELLNKIDKVAVALKQLNVLENECVTICMPNIPEAIFIIYAVNKIGAICNVIHPLNKVDEIKRAIEETNSTVLFTTDVTYNTVKDLKIKNLIVCEVSNSMNSLLGSLYNIKNKKNMKYNDNVIRWNTFMKSGNNVVNTHVNRGQDSPAVIIYSGGTTGKSKGIILSNLCFNSISKQCEVVCKEARAGNSILSALPIFHGFGLCVCIHVPLSIGLKCILVPKINTSKINKLIRDRQPNLLPVIPSLLNIITNSKYYGPKSFKDVQVILSGGDYLSDELRDRTEKYFRKCGSIAHIQIGYGLSEATAFISATCESVKSINNIGIPNPDNIMKIFEPETDIELEPNSIGEICVNGPSIMLGYINQDKETSNVLKKHYDGKIWLHTGDIGCMDSDGFIYYKQRLKRMIVTSGYNVYPSYIESIINNHKYVDTSVVIGIPHPYKKQVAKAYIVLKDGIKVNNGIKREIKKYCEENLVKYSWPYEYEYISELPKTLVGKVAYKELEKERE